MRTIKAFKGRLELKDDIEVVYEKKVTKYGTGAKIDCMKEHMGKSAYVLIRKKRPSR
jgi:putative transposon-encoded protein